MSEEKRQIIELLVGWRTRYSYEQTAMSQAEFARCVEELLEVMEPPIPPNHISEAEGV